MPSSGIAVSYGSSIFSFLRKLHTRDCHTECSKSEREKQILYINAYMWNLTNSAGEPVLERRNGDVDVENRFMNIEEEERVGQIAEVALTYIHHCV